ncbi:MAG: hypothetical protein ACK50Q_01800 [Labrys sp. (in: a-proteobacteria)]|jgi:hypothetical protein
MFGLFRRPSPQERAKAEVVKEQVRRDLALEDEATVSVSEIDCGDAACPGLETVILVMRPGHRTRAFKVAGALMAIDAAAVTAALSQPET